MASTGNHKWFIKRWLKGKHKEIKLFISGKTFFRILCWVIQDDTVMVVGATGAAICYLVVMIAIGNKGVGINGDTNPFLQILKILFQI